jgi:hypothetical protein
MLLYSVSENGALRKVKKVDFAENKVFLIDDNKTIFLWQGQKASKKKKELSEKKAEKLNKERGEPAKIEIFEQGKEYGAFLPIMEGLKKGFGQISPIERRDELQIQYEDTIDLIEAGLTPDLEGVITVNAHNLAQEGKSYEELCKILAEMQISLIKEKGKPTVKEIKKKQEEIFKSSSTYEEVCWLISQIRLIKEKKIGKQKLADFKPPS